MTGPSTGSTPDDEPARPWPAPRRSRVLPVTLAAMMGIGLASGAYMVRHAPLPPAPDGGPRCARAFDARLRIARGGTDADLVALGREALATGCGRQAFAAAEAVGCDADEAGAWMLARFSDPAETDPAIRRAARPDPARAAACYRTWSARSPRMAAALTALCAGEGAGPKAACARVGPGPPYP